MVNNNIPSHDKVSFNDAKKRGSVLRKVLLIKTLKTCSVGLTPQDTVII